MVEPLWSVISGVVGWCHPCGDPVEKAMEFLLQGKRRGRDGNVMGILLGQLGAMQTSLWAESEPSQAIRAEFNEGDWHWDIIVYIRGSGIIEGHCGGQVLRHRIQGLYRPGDSLRARIGGNIFGETLQLYLQNASRICGTLGGTISGCRVQADVQDQHIVGWLQSRGIHRERLVMNSGDVEPPIVLMIGCIACYFGCFLFNDQLRF